MTAQLSRARGQGPGACGRRWPRALILVWGALSAATAGASRGATVPALEETMLHGLAAAPCHVQWNDQVTLVLGPRAVLSARAADASLLFTVLSGDVRVEAVTGERPDVLMHPDATVQIVLPARRLAGHADAPVPCEAITGALSARVLRSPAAVMDVRADTAGSHVLVISGSADVQASGARGRRLYAREELVCGCTDELPPRVHRVPRAVMERRLAWTEGVLWFDGEPVESVIAEINRFGSTSLRVSSAAAAALPVAGRIRLGEPGPFLDTLRSLGVQVDFARPDDSTLMPVRVSSAPLQGALPGQ